jgi:succinate dehydrogenase/fumarate reductase flavoprotein subunit
MKLIKEQQRLSCGVLVIGGGGAGLRSAIAAKLKNADVLLASKNRIGLATNTYISKAIIAATGWGTPSDDKNVHATDTIKGGCFLSDHSMVMKMTERVPSEISFLRDSGVRFGTKDGSIRIVRTPGHSYPRHVYGENSIGSDLIRPLRNLAQKLGVRFREHVFVTRLLVDDGRITGATGLNRDGTFVTIQANVVVLASGGFAQIYLNNDNAAGITGDGQALAYDLGVPLKDLEFVQFYPTATGTRGNRIFLYERITDDSLVRMKRKGRSLHKAES